MELEDGVRADRVDRARDRVGVLADAGRRAVRPARPADVAVRVRPAAGVPGPVDPGAAQAVADRRRGLRLRELRAERPRGLERRPHRVHGEVAAREVEARRRRADDRERAALDRSRRRVERVRGRHPVRVDDRVQRVRRVVEDGRPGGDQPLVVEERAAERGLEEVVRDRVVRVRGPVEVAVDRQELRVVDAHGRPGRIATGRVAVLLPVVQLELLLVELVHEVARAAAGLADRVSVEDPVREAERVQRRRARVRGRRDEVVDREPRVREVARDPVLRVRAVGRQRRRGQVHVELLQAVVGDAVLVDLRGVRGVGVRAAVHALPAAVEVVEAVVLLVDDHDVLDLRELVLPARRRQPARGGQQHDGRQDRQQQPHRAPSHLSPPLVDSRRASPRGAGRRDTNGPPGGLHRYPA